MARLCVLICRIDDEAHPEALTPLQRVELPPLDPHQLPQESAVDQLETRALSAGQEVMRHLLRHQWQVVDEQLAADARRLSPPGDDHG